MSSEMLVLPFEGKGYVSASATQVVDRYGTELPMTVSTTTVDFDALTVGGVAVATGGVALTGLTATATELNYLDIATLGTGAASKAVVLDASGDYTYPASATIVHPSGATETHASGSTVNIAGTFQVGGVTVTSSAAELNILAGVTATAAELNSVDVSLNTETIAEGGVISVTKAITKIASTGAGAVTLAVPDASMLGKIKIVEMISGEHDVTLSLANVQGGSAATTATFSDINDALVLVGGVAKWHVVGESGVVLS